MKIAFDGGNMEEILCCLGSGFNGCSGSREACRFGSDIQSVRGWLGLTRGVVGF
jgi:hypothetical protein